MYKFEVIEVYKDENCIIQPADNFLKLYWR